MGLSLPPPLLLLLLCVAPLVDAQATAPPPVCPVPPGVDAGAPTSVCVSGSVTLTGTQTGSTATVAWSGGPGTFSSPTALTTNFDPANGQGGKTLTLTLTGHSSDGTCADAVSTVAVMVERLNVAAAGPDQSICQTGSATMAASSTGGTTTGQWSNFAPGAMSDVFAGNALFTPAAAQYGSTVALTWQTTGGICPATSDNVRVTVDRLHTANAGPAQSVCVSNSVTLAATFGGGATGGTWSNQGPGTLSAPSSPSSTFTPASPQAGTTVNLRWSTTGGACPSVFDTVAITVERLNVATAGPNQAICQTQTATMAASSTGGTTTGQWLNFAPGTMSSVTSGTAVFTPAAAQYGSTVALQWQTTGGLCASNTDTVNVRVDRSNTVTAGPAQTICLSGTATMAATVTGGATGGTWSGFGPGSMTPVTSPTAVFDPGPAQVGPVVLTWSSTGGACPAVFDTVTITVRPLPTVNAGPDQIICITGTATLAASFGGSATGGRWSGMGAGSVDDVFSRTAVFSPVASQAGSIVQLVWTSQGGPCTSVSDMVDINVAVLPQVNAGPDQLICVTGTATMDATFGGSATGGVWSGFGAGVMSNVNQRKAIFTPVAAQAGTTVSLTWTSLGGPCAPVADSIDVAVAVLPTVDAGPRRTICAAGAASLAASFGGSATGGVWSNFSPGSMSSVTNPRAVFTPHPSQANTTVRLRWTSTGGPCSSVLDETDVIISAFPGASAGPTQTVCVQGFATMAASVSGSASGGTWSNFAPGTMSNINDPSAIFTPSMQQSGQTVRLVWTTTGSACSSETSTVDIVVAPLPVVTAGVDLTVCAGGNVTLSATWSPSATGGRWEGYEPGTLTNPTLVDAVFVPHSSQSGKKVSLTWRSTGGPCAPALDVLEITVQSCDLSTEAKIGIAVGVSAAVVLLVLGVVALVLWKMKTTRDDFFKLDEPLQDPDYGVRDY